MSHKTLNLTPALEAHRKQDVEACLQEVTPLLKSVPHHPVALHLKAWAMSRKGQNDQALEILSGVVEKNPKLVSAKAEYGSILMRARRHAEALQPLQEAFEQQPERDEVAHKYGICLMKNHQFAEAEKQLRLLLERSPNHFGAQFSLSLALLHQGKWEEGFEHYQIRSWLDGMSVVDLKERYIEWTGDEPLEGKTLLIQCEQGYGDQIMFVRYVRWVKESFQPEKIILFSEPEMQALLETVPGVDEVVTSVEGVAADRYVPLLNLPFFHGTTPETIPFHEDAYIELPEERTRKWKQIFSGDRRKIALCWRANTIQSEVSEDINAERLVKSLRIKHVEFVLDRLKAIFPDSDILSIQPGLTKKERIMLNRRKIKDLWQHGIRDFADTAAILEQMDLVVSIDTAVAHLAAALNRPVWNLLPYSADWRWSQDEEQSAWYPAMKLFRQKEEDDWMSLELK